MFIKILFNYRGKRTHFKGERTQVECVVRANGLDTRFDLLSFVCITLSGIFIVGKHGMLFVLHWAMFSL
jgi:hypothetical protein